MLSKSHPSLMKGFPKKEKHAFTFLPVPKCLFFLQVKQFVRMSLRRSGLDGHCKTLCLTNRTTDTGCVGKLSGGG